MDHAVDELASRQLKRHIYQRRARQRGYTPGTHDGEQAPTTRDQLVRAAIEIAGEHGCLW